MAEGKSIIDKPRKLWDGALKIVKGENPNQLIEHFTAEMTLVAEGLCEDQTRLRREVDEMSRQEDQQIQKLQSRADLLESMLEEERNAHDRDVTELRNRLAALEKKAARESSSESGRDKKKSRTVIRDLTWLVGIAAGAWIIVTILNLFRQV
jgi:hypothetical protein